MISLTQAFKLCHIRNDEIVYIISDKETLISEDPSLLYGWG